MPIVLYNHGYGNLNPHNALYVCPQCVIMHYTDNIQALLKILIKNQSITTNEKILHG